MPLVAIASALSYLRVDSGDDDLTVQDLLDGATQSALDYLNRQVFADAESMASAVSGGTAGDYPMVVNNAIKAGILKTLGELYANREDTVVGTLVSLPLNAKSLLRPHRISPGL